jgi:hypothetical protein
MIMGELAFGSAFIVWMAGFYFVRIIEYFSVKKRIRC